ncbi:hypothetical protein BKI52_32460 [marine bacterium AO1-C]|nr:hypothetical protein BKI52_32460 [marine bacterium AO1-C]
MKKYIKRITTLVLVAVFTFSCKNNLLDIQPASSLSGNSYNSEKNLLAALYASYEVLQWQSVDGIHVFPLMWQGIRADDLHSQFASFWTAGTIMDDFSLMNANNPSVEKLWKKWYTGVNRANIVIEKAAEFNGWSSAQAQQQVIAEAKVLRAFYYFELVRMWGGVPLILNNIESTDDIPALGRSTTAELYAQIDKDLLEAISSESLASKGGVAAGRVTIGLAKTLLAKSKLYQKDYASCVKYCEEVMNSGEFSLETNFANNFSLDNENGVESILEIQYGDGFTATNFEVANQNSQGSAMWQMCFTWVSGRYTSFSNMLPLGELTAQYDRTNDTRFDATFITVGTDLSQASPKLAQNWGSPVAEGQMSWLRPNLEDCNYSRKYFLSWETVDQLLNVQQSPKNEKIIRYAEVLLMHAEAQALGGGGAISGLSSINALRQRAGIAALGTYTLADVKLERRKELATEGWNRFSDLVRWGDAASNARLISKNFTPGRDELLPIPQNERNLVGFDKLAQNPGY